MKYRDHLLNLLKEEQHFLDELQRELYGRVISEPEDPKQKGTEVRQQDLGLSLTLLLSPQAA